MDENIDKDLDPGEIAYSKAQLLARDKMTILKTEAYAMPSSTYVPDDSHTFVVSEDKNICWANFGRCWKDKGDRTLVASQNSYKEWLFEFCPPDNYSKCGIIFGINGVCHTTANRELLIGENDVSVKDASKNFVTVSVFGKYGCGLDILKQLVTDTFNEANATVEMTESMLKTVLARIDNTLDDEVSAWKQLIETYFKLQISNIINEHSDALEQLKVMVKSLLDGRENEFKQFLLQKYKKVDYQFVIYNLMITNVNNYLDFLLTKNYISSEQNNLAKNNATKFLSSLFKSFEKQTQTVETTGKLDQNLANDLLF